MWYGASLVHLSRQKLYDYMDYIVSVRNLCASSVCKEMHIIMALLSLGHRMGVLPVNVGAGLNLPKFKDCLNERILSPEQVRAIICASDRPLMLRVLYYSGIRRAELIGLTWADVQRAHGRGQLTVFGKGRKTRTVGIPLSVYEELEAVRGVDAHPVFARPDGKPGCMSPEQAHRIFKRASVKAEIPKASLHWFRHAFGTSALEGGASLPTVQRDLGHTSTATTGKYLHARPQDACSDYLEEL